MQKTLIYTYSLHLGGPCLGPSPSSPLSVGTEPPERLTWLCEENPSFSLKRHLLELTETNQFLIKMSMIRHFYN